MRIITSSIPVQLLATVCLLAGCSGGGGGGGGGNDSANTPPPVQEEQPPATEPSGTLTLLITDAPVDSAVEVWVEFAAIELKPKGGEAFTIEFEEPKVFDLLALTGDNTAELVGDEPVEPGDYNWIRLDVNADEDGVFDSFVMTDIGEMIELEVTSRKGLQLVSGFTVGNGGAVSFVIDWDLRKGLTIPKGAGKSAWKLKPALRITDLSVDGTIAGTVAEELLTDDSCTNDLATDTGNAVYLFEGTDTPPEDIHTEETDPIATASVTQDENGFYVYQMDFIAPGEYTVAFTCQALNDDPEIDDDIAFSTAQSVAISDNENLVVDF